MTRLRWGVLSTASIARVVAAANPGRFVAVAGRDPGRTASFAAGTGIERTFDGYAAMLAGDEIDAVYIPLPNALHTEWTIAALEAGKHVLCEKPFAATAADAARCFDVAEAHDRVLTEGFMWRLHPQTLLAQQLIADGAIGRVGTVRAALRITTGSPDDIRLSPALGGGALADLGCYCVSAIRLFAGDPTRLSAEAVFAQDSRERPSGGHATASEDNRAEVSGSGHATSNAGDRAATSGGGRAGTGGGLAETGGDGRAETNGDGLTVMGGGDDVETKRDSHAGTNRDGHAGASGVERREHYDAGSVGVDMRMGAVLRGLDGRIGVFDCALDLPRADELEIVGSQGVLRVPDPWLCGGGELLLTRKGVTERLPVDPDGAYNLVGGEADAYRIEFDVFEEVVAGRRAHPFGRVDAIAQAATLDAIRRSARSGQAATI